MNKDEIMKMEAGRELDALVAEKVMGWILIQDVEYHSLGGAMFAEDKSTGTRQFLWHLRENVYSGETGWCPSTDIAAAWMIVEKMEPAYFMLVRTNETDWSPAPWGDTHWRCRFYAPEKGEAFAPTASLAICRAALLAVMECE